MVINKFKTNQRNYQSKSDDGEIVLFFPILAFLRRRRKKAKEGFAIDRVFFIDMVFFINQVFKIGIVSSVARRC